MKYFERNGFQTPILVREKEGLGLRVPHKDFSVADVERHVGESRLCTAVAGS